MAERVEVDLIVKAITKGFAQVRGDFKKVAEEQKKSQTASEALKESWLKMAAVVGTVTVAIGTMKKAIDFAEAGAEVMQMGESWDMLLDKVGAAPDLLDQLQKSSRGTISDMDLMTSTATLLAGASGDLAERLAEATPELLEIAKAANKLNPSLGSTAFLYNSIATGVKRASPLILDNLGLTIKVGAANEAMAKKLGKTVEQLTVQERSMAILNDTMRAGKVLIEQVGGSVDAAGDDFAQFETNIKNLSDSIKETTYGAIQPLIQGLVDLMELAEGGGSELNLLEVALATVGINLDGVNRALDVLHEKAEAARQAEADLADATRDEADAARIQEQALLDSANQAGDTRQAIYDLLNVTEDAAEAQRDFALSLSEVTAASMAAEALRALEEAYKDGLISIDDYKIGFSEIATNIGDMDVSAIMAIVHMAELEKEYEDGIIDAKEYAEKILNLKNKISSLEDKTVTITMHTRYTYGEGGVGGGPDYARYGKPGSPQRGGPLSGLDKVGEAGWEYVLDGVVIPHEESKRLEKLGFGRGGRGFQWGGEVWDYRSGVGTVGTGATTPAPYAPYSVVAGAAQSLPVVTGGGAVTAGTPVVSAATVSESQQVAQITAQQVTAGVASTLATTQAEQIVALRTTLMEQTRETKKQLAELQNIRAAIQEQGTMEDLGDIMVAAEE